MVTQTERKLNQYAYTLWGLYLQINYTLVDNINSAQRALQLCNRQFCHDIRECIEESMTTCIKLSTATA